jgi:predicted nucleic acid-binding protein
MKVIETNVAISANGKNTHASLECQLACIVTLSDIVANKEIIAIDELGLILEEYARHLNYSGQPEVGDEFFKYLNDHQYYAQRVSRVEITPNNIQERGFDELPANKMDPSDRKFLAVAVVSQAVIINALDSDWHENIKEINKMGVKVTQLCPDHACKLRDV